MNQFIKHKRSYKTQNFLKKLPKWEITICDYYKKKDNTCQNTNTKHPEISYTWIGRQKFTEINK